MGSSRSSSGSFRSSLGSSLSSLCWARGFIQRSKQISVAVFQCFISSVSYRFVNVDSSSLSGSNHRCCLHLGFRHFVVGRFHGVVLVSPAACAFLRFSFIAATASASRDPGVFSLAVTIAAFLAVHAHARRSFFQHQLHKLFIEKIQFGVCLAHFGDGCHEFLVIVIEQFNGLLITDFEALQRRLFKKTRAACGEEAW